MLIAIFILLFAAPGWCAIIHVPADYPTVQRALYAAAQHDTVLVADGRYYENLVFPPINLTLASQFLMDGDSTHISNTILDGSQPSNPDSGSVIYMTGGQDSTTVIAGLTIREGSGTLNSSWSPPPQLFGGGCVIRQSSPILNSNYIHSNGANRGGGLYLGKGAKVALRNNRIFHNFVTGNFCQGGGIYGDSCAPVIASNHIHHNVSAYGSGGFYCKTPDSVLIINNWFDHNRAAANFGGGFFVNGYYAVIGNIIADNEAAGNAGFHFGANPHVTHVTVTNNQFLRNITPDIKGALSLASGAIGIISQNLFQDNSAIWAAGLNLWEGTYTVSDNQFINNGGVSGGVIYIGTGYSVDMHGNTITGSIGSPQYSSAIFVYAGTPVDIYNNNIYGNSSPAVASPLANINADSNWWGDPTGPYHPTLNPGGLGDTVGDNVLFNPWLTSLVSFTPIQGTAPTEFRIFPPRPNPFNDTTLLRYVLPASSHVILTVCDITGRRVALLVDELQSPGAHSITFDGSKLASGIYLYRLTASGSGATPTMITGKMVLLK